MSGTRSRIYTSLLVPRFTGCSSSSRGQHHALCGLVDVEELTARGAGAPHLDVIGASFFGVDALFDERGDDVRNAGMETVAGTVQVGGHQIGAALTVLVAVCGELHQ